MTAAGMEPITFGWSFGSTYPSDDEARRFSVPLGWDGGNFLYVGDPLTGRVASVPTYDAAVNGCRWTYFGDRFYWRGMVNGWGRNSRYQVLTDAGKVW